MTTDKRKQELQEICEIVNIQTLNFLEQFENLNLGSFNYNERLRVSDNLNDWDILIARVCVVDHEYRHMICEEKRCVSVYVCS